MSIAKLLFPRARDGRKRREFRAIQTGILVGLISSGLMALMLYLIYAGKLK